MVCLYECSMGNTGKSTRLLRLLEKFLSAARRSRIEIRKGRGRGPGKKDAFQTYVILARNRDVVKVRFATAGDSEERVRKNVSDAKNDGINVLITAAHDEKWLDPDAKRFRRRSCREEENDLTVEKMWNLLKRILRSKFRVSF